MCPKLIEILSWNGPTVHVCCFMLARASTKTFVNRVQKTAKKPSLAQKFVSSVTRQPRYHCNSKQIFIRYTALTKLVFITETEWVNYTLLAEYLNIIQVNRSLDRANVTEYSTACCRRPVQCSPFIASQKQLSLATANNGRILAPQISLFLHVCGSMSNTEIPCGSSVL